MKRKRKIYSRPKKAFDSLRIEEENEIRKKFGLKNKKEIWKADARIKRIRNIAKELIPAGEDEKAKLFAKLQKEGFDVKTIGDVLSLTKEDYLKRRLQNILFEKKLATTQKQARQFITHKKVIVGEKGVNSPSYHVCIDEEDKIKLKVKNKNE